MHYAPWTVIEPSITRPQLHLLDVDSSPEEVGRYHDALLEVLRFLVFPIFSRRSCWESGTVYTLKRLHRWAVGMLAHDYTLKRVYRSRRPCWD